MSKKNIRNAAKQASAVKLSQADRWRKSVAAAKCLPPHTADANGLYNKDHCYRAVILAHAAGVTLTLDEVLDMCPGYSRAKAGSYLRRWLKIAAGTMTPDTSVPKMSRDFVVPKSKTTAGRKLTEAKRQYTTAKTAGRKSKSKSKSEE